MPCDRSTNRKHRRPPKNKEKLTSLQCRMASDIRAERQNSNVGRRPTYERKGGTHGVIDRGAVWAQWRSGAQRTSGAKTRGTPLRLEGNVQRQD
ncbi:hypothetical protein J6590_049626 [Homalodisca vitripennis]|nr:hypothetical protein J6590_049626 [Homalodisca vitripennis]